MIDLIKEQKRFEEVLSSPFFLRKGKIHTVQNQYFIAKGPKANIGDTCKVGDKGILCEVIGVIKEDNYLLPFDSNQKVSNGDMVEMVGKGVLVPKKNNLLGKVLNANGEIINGDNDVEKEYVDLEKPPIGAFEREGIDSVLQTGVKVIDGMLTVGLGQKIGIFAGSGVGKSTLLGMIAKRAKVDVNVIALVGERGREVKDFIRKELGEEGLKRSVLVVATSDEGYLMQLRAAKLATSIAEMFRDEGKDVMLMMDSIKRFADARTSIDIAVKEYPIGGKTLEMQNSMKQLLERSGKTEKGSITGIYTVLVDGDDMNEPVADLARGILDGHIVLDRDLATKNHYPAIAVSKSVSRVMEEIVSKEHWAISSRVRSIMSTYEKNETFLKMGTIAEIEANKEIFEARDKMKEINNFLTQDVHESFELKETLETLTNCT